jgi:hypothetical protein
MSLRPTTLEPDGQLYRAGLRIAICTGNNTTTAAAAAEPAGVGDVKADARPKGKRYYLKASSQKGRIVDLAGDRAKDSLFATSERWHVCGNRHRCGDEQRQNVVVKGDLRGIANASLLY